MENILIHLIDQIFFIFGLHQSLYQTWNFWIYTYWSLNLMFQNASERKMENKLLNVWAQIPL